MELTDEDVMANMQDSPIYFAEIMWGLVPQPLKPEYRTQMKIGLTMKHDEWQTFVKSVKKDWFEPFVKGEMITWQQWLILLCIEKALRGEASKKISIVSGRGIGKSSIFAIIILWFLFCYPYSNIPCTAVTKDQLDDAMWKELAMWLEKMPDEIKDRYEYSSDHLRMKESPKTWFARARTASKDRPEALSGVHADWILAIIDEASAVHEKVFEMGQGVLTSDNAFIIMISNGTVLDGTFYRSHNDNSSSYQCLAFNSEESPIVNYKYVQSIIDEYCTNVDPKNYHSVTEYRVNVMGLFPKAGVMDDKGYVALLDEKDIVEEDGDYTFVGHRFLGLDPAGDGDDLSAWVGRDRIRAQVLGEEQVSTPASIAGKTVTYTEKIHIPTESYRDIVVDAFGVGHSVSQEVAIMTQGKGRITPINVGEPCPLESDQELYVNIRAMIYWKLRTWIKKGGTIGRHPGLKKELLSIRYRRVGSKIQIESKLEMKKRGVKSPNYADALALTFLRELQANFQTPEETNRIRKMAEEFDKNSIFGN